MLLVFIWCTSNYIVLHIVTHPEAVPRTQHLPDKQCALLNAWCIVHSAWCCWCMVHGAWSMALLLVDQVSCYRLRHRLMIDPHSQVCFIL